MIAHGHGRNTFGADIWLEPFAEAAEWAELVQEVLGDFFAAQPLCIGAWEPIAAGDLLRDLPMGERCSVTNREGEAPAEPCSQSMGFLNAEKGEKGKDFGNIESFFLPCALSDLCVSPIRKNISSVKSVVSPVFY